ncbi:MAG: hypothetical protein J2P22_09955 [Nocardioides sp.]|nr:hypothetical protein [Nocardioides sp.]
MAPAPDVPAGTQLLTPGSTALGAALAAATTLAAVLTLAVPGLLSGPAAMSGSARGTALVVLVGGVPALVVGLAGSLRGSIRMLTITGGAAAYLLYNAVMFLFATPVNQAFLVYELMLGLGLWFLVVLCRRLWVIGVTLELRPPRWVAVYVGTLVVLNALAWLSRVIDATLSRHPDSLLTGTGLTTNPVYVQDLAVWLPAYAWVAVGIWKAHGPRVLLGAAALTAWLLEAVGVAVDQWWAHHADPASQVASLAAVPAFAVVAVVTVWPLTRILRSVPDATPSWVAGNERSHPTHRFHAAG